MKNKITVPETIAGLTESQIHAYFAEASKLAGFGVGYTCSAVTGKFQTWQSLPVGVTTSNGLTYVCETGDTLEKAIETHASKCPPTGPELAAEKRKQAKKLIAEADAISASNAQA